MDNVKYFRLWVKGENLLEDNYIKIAKIELVGNQWEQLGVVTEDSNTYPTEIDNSYNLDFEINSLESVETIYVKL